GDAAHRLTHRPTLPGENRPVDAPVVAVRHRHEREGEGDGGHHPGPSPAPSVAHGSCSAVAAGAVGVFFSARGMMPTMGHTTSADRPLPPSRVSYSRMRGRPVTDTRVPLVRRSEYVTASSRP